MPSLRCAPQSARPSAPTRPGLLRVERTVGFRPGDERPTYDVPKTRGSRRRVLLPPAAVAVLRDYLARHPHGPASPRYDPVAPLFPGFRLAADKPTGRAGTTAGAPAAARATAQAARLAELDTTEAAARLDLDWGVPVRHQNFYKAVYRPAVLRASLAASELGATAQAEVSRPTPHLRLAVRGGGDPTPRDRPVHGPRQGHYDPLRLRPPVPGRPHRRYGCPGGYGYATTRERGPD